MITLQKNGQDWRKVMYKGQMRAGFDASTVDNPDVRAWAHAPKYTQDASATFALLPEHVTIEFSYEGGQHCVDILERGAVIVEGGGPTREVALAAATLGYFCFLENAQAVAEQGG